MSFASILVGYFVGGPMPWAFFRTSIEEVMQNFMSFGDKSRFSYGGLKEVIRTDV